MMKNRLLACLALLAAIFPASFGALAASFDCGKARSYAEKTICADPALSALDDELAVIYVRAKAKIAASGHDFDGHSPSENFARNTGREWRLREKTCKNKACLLRWYQKRRATLSALAELDEAPGMGGIVDVKQYENGNVSFALSMSTHKRQFLVDVWTRQRLHLGDGDLTILSQAPLLYRLDMQKSYFAGGGAFWYHTIRNAQRQIVDIALEDEAIEERCLKRKEFFKKTGWKKRRLAAFRGKEICKTFERGSTYCTWRALDAPRKGMTPDPVARLITLFTVGGVEAPLCKLEPVPGTDKVDIICPTAPQRNGRMEVIQYDPKDADYMITRFKGHTYYRRCTRDR